MAKIVTIHQPNYLPWIGLFGKVKQSDCLILGDTYQLGGQSVFNRNKIRTADGWRYLTIPLGHKSEGCRICDISLPKEIKWRREHWKLIHDNYQKSPYFNLYKDFFEQEYRKDFKYLCQFNEEIIRYLFKCFEINPEVIRASEMEVDPSLQKTDLMIQLLKGAGAEVYLSGPSGNDYLEMKKFSENNIKLKFFKFQHPTYIQRYAGFEASMAAVDLLFNTGPEAGEIIRLSGSMVDEQLF
jgi:hypothetical protein